MTKVRWKNEYLLVLDKIKECSKNKNTYIYGALALVLLYAFLVRFYRISFGLPYLHSWDEPLIASNALKILKTGDFNPHFFNYPAFPIYSCFLIDVIHYFYLIGQKVSSFDYLRSVNDIIISVDTGWIWTISHPSFYFWNRAFIAILGTLSVVWTYVISTKVFGKLEGLLSALFISGFSYHVFISSQITVDIPGMFFGLLVVMFALKFNSSLKIEDLVYSLIFVGLAASCKYNLMISIIAPLSAYFFNIRKIKSKKSLIFFMIFFLPFIVFFIVNPYALLDFKNFISDVGYELYHYKIKGHLANTAVPGTQHFLLQMGRIKNNIGSILFFLAIIGLGIGMRKPKKLFLLSVFPIIYTYFMVHQKASFHRNYILLYSFFSIFAAVSIVFIAKIFSQLGLILQKKYSLRKKYLTNFLFFTPIIIVVLLLSNNYFSLYNNSSFIKNSSETRSRAIDYINRLIYKEKDKNLLIGIASELRIHRLDLERLRAEYEEFDQMNIEDALNKYDF